MGEVQGAGIEKLPAPEQLICEALMRTLDLDGCAASLWDGTSDRIGLGSTNDDLLRLAELNFTLWEGPGPDAVTTGAMVTTSDLLEEQHRWPMLLSQLGETSIRALVVVPLRLETNDPEAPPIGLMSAYRREPIAFDLDELSVVLRLADGLSAVTAWRVDRFAAFQEEFVFPHTVIHQAIKLLSGKLNINGPDALATLRARAFLDGCTLRELARRLVNKELVPDETWCD